MAVKYHTIPYHTIPYHTIPRSAAAAVVVVVFGAVQRGSNQALVEALGR